MCEENCDIDEHQDYRCANYAQGKNETCVTWLWFMHNFLVKLQGLMSSSKANKVVCISCNQLSSLSFNG